MIIIYYKRVYKDNHTCYSYRPFPNEEFTVQSKVRLGRKKEDLPCLCRKMQEDDPRQGSLLLPAAAAAISY